MLIVIIRNTETLLLNLIKMNPEIIPNIKAT